MRSYLLYALVCSSYHRPFLRKTQKDILTFGNCTVGFFYPENWKDFITDASDCEQSYTEINFPQPSLSAKNPPYIIVQVEKCCEFLTSFDETGYSAIPRNMSLEEYVDQEIRQLTVRPDVTIINSGPIILGGNETFPAHKIIAGPDSSSPAYLAVYSKKGDKMYSIIYSADPSDYATYLPGLQTIADSFQMFVS
jgi:hypothetical protein